MKYELLHTLGYYALKKKYRTFCLRWRLIREDTKRKQQILNNISSLTSSILQCYNNSSDVIVSLTSYGARVSETLPCTVYSLLQQSVKPNRIIVWLDNINWSLDNLPEPLRQLQKAGVEVMFCKDIRSYKKLIPTLRLYPNNIIITVDDDMYYNEHLIEWLLDAYQLSNKNVVIGTKATRITNVDGVYLPYSKWD